MGLTRPAIHEEFRHLFQRRLPPLGDLDGVHFELRCQLAERLVTADRLNHHPCFELRTVLLVVVIDLSLSMTPPKILAYCLV